ncbi:CCDC90 family protein [Mycoavidus sp. HKI]|uniref:CCDC90 family protein n=1 Tax=Mycoavidus sp. HKI TaxID=2840467 RepID=UPI001CBAED93|nr:CCDC90 family protein [Mycoavidus sp. HKI]UAW64223.1 CCDC90 family protein [Mycoavidus sp. HKI]
MAIALFDTLKFAKRLKEAGVSSAHAEAEAEVLSEIFAVNFQELPTKQDLQAVKEELQHEIKDVRTEIKDLRTEIKGVREELRVEIKDVRVEIKDLRKDISGFRTEVDSKLEKLELRLTIKLTFIMAALLGAAAALSKFFS